MLKLKLQYFGHMMQRADSFVKTLMAGKDRRQEDVRKHLTGGLLYAVLDLSGIFWPLLISQYSGIKRRGMPFPGLRNLGMSFVSFSIR